MDCLYVKILSFLPEFSPDNEKDNYTNAVIGINKEFLNKFNSSSYEKTTTKTTTKTTIKQEKLLK